jgi:hypothetical protein
MYSPPQEFAKNFSLQAATVIDGTKPDSLFKAPVLGFKLNCEM